MERLTDLRSDQLMKKVLATNQMFPFVIKGKCMEPVLCDGEKVFVKLSEKYEIGQIVLLKDNQNRYLAHRIVDIDRKKSIVVTAGDNNSIADNPTKIENIIGVVINSKDDPYSAIYERIIKIYIPQKYSDLIKASNNSQTDIVFTRNLTNIIKDSKDNDSLSIVFFKGARRHISEINFGYITKKKLSIFIGYRIGNYTDEDENTIGVDDVDIIVRTNKKIWVSNDINTEFILANIIF